jgi:ankyrin repeat protein
MDRDGIHSASQRGDLAAVKRHLAQKGADINLKDWLGKTALLAAAEEGHLNKQRSKE